MLHINTFQYGISILDACGGYLYPFGANLLLICPTRTPADEAHQNCQEVGGRLVELETPDKLDAFLEARSSFLARYTSMHNIPFFIYKKLGLKVAIKLILVCITLKTII